MKLALFILALCSLLVSATSFAECHKAQLCDDYGRYCKAMDVCDSTLDVASSDVTPLRPLPSLEVKPLSSLDLPPLGTSDCQQRQVNGQWRNICR